MQLDRRNYKKGTYAMPSYTYKEKHREDPAGIQLASQLTVIEGVETLSVDVVTEHCTIKHLPCFYPANSKACF